MIAEPKETARSAGLRYVAPEAPGLRREKSGEGFRYLDPRGRTVRDAGTLGRIRRLAIPPAWSEVWICPDENGHLQAHGRDARGRRQYRYHPDWTRTRDEAKFERVIAFGRVLPRLRQRLARDLRRPGLGRTKVLAAVVRLLETSLIRVGNEEYARTNHSFGLSTLRDRHVSIRGDTLHFHFKGKSGVVHDLDLRDARLARIVKKTQDLPGQVLFQYLDEETGEPRKVHSEDVNAYLRSACGGEFSAKDFRTWAGTVLAALALRRFEKCGTKSEAKKNVVAAVESVAKRLGNTPAVCRKCYIHPVIFDSYLEGKTVETLRAKAEAELTHVARGLGPEEQAVLAFLRQTLTRKKRA